MDNMAYLQQIAGADNSLANKKKGGGLPKFLNKWVLIGVAVFMVLLMAGMAILSSFNQVDTKDQDLMGESYWRAYNLNEKVLNKYASQVKNSELRDISASFISVLGELITNTKTLALSEFGIKVESMSESKDPTRADALSKTLELVDTLEDGRINGLLDRVYLREMTMQVAYMRSYESEIAARTKNSIVQSASEKAKNNLDIIYNQFHDFKSDML